MKALLHLKVTTQHSPPEPGFLTTALALFDHLSLSPPVCDGLVAEPVNLAWWVQASVG